MTYQHFFTFLNDGSVQLKFWEWKSITPSYMTFFDMMFFDKVYFSKLVQAFKDLLMASFGSILTQKKFKKLKFFENVSGY